MAEVQFFEDPAEVLKQAGGFLRTRPVEHNLVMGLLEDRVVHPEPGRFWTVQEQGEVVGVVFNSPVDFTAALTPMSDTAAASAADAIARQGVVLSGASGEAATASRFAGQWAESSGLPVETSFGQRIYRFVEPGPVPEVEGRLRPAAPSELELIVDWNELFRADIGPTGPNRNREQLTALIKRRIAEESLWVWDVDSRPVSMAGVSIPVAGVVRVGPVFTPAGERRKGYAGACVGALSRRKADAGNVVILWTELVNPTSNALYYRLGYRAVVECIVYKFQPRVAAEAVTRL